MFTPVTIDSRDALRAQNNGTLNFQSLNVRYLGPKALAMFFSGIETGVIIVLFARFFARKKERLAIQLLVYFATFMALYVAFENTCYIANRFFIFIFNCSHTTYSLFDIPLVLTGNRFQTATTFASWWRVSVLQFGNWVSGSYCHPVTSQLTSLHRFRPTHSPLPPSAPHHLPPFLLRIVGSF